ncbi:MAG: hypothetical protein IJO51_03165 [Clostridia bacterium]|nr:hypothetical protein [Clostridia bacterium]
MDFKAIIAVLPAPGQNPTEFSRLREIDKRRPLCGRRPIVKEPLRWVLFDIGVPACGPVSLFFCGKTSGLWCFYPAHVRSKTDF